MIAVIAVTVTLLFSRSISRANEVKVGTLIGKVVMTSGKRNQGRIEPAFDRLKASRPQGGVLAGEKLPVCCGMKINPRRLSNSSLLGEITHNRNLPLALALSNHSVNAMSSLTLLCSLFLLGGITQNSYFPLTVALSSHSFNLLSKREIPVFSVLIGPMADGMLFSKTDWNSTDMKEQEKKT
jgi:hypothetical protein